MISINTLHDTNNNIPLEELSLNQLGKNVFGVNSSILRKWPGLHTYVNFLQSELQGNGQNNVQKVLQHVYSTEKQFTSSEQVDFVAELAALIRPGIIDQTIDNILRLWIATRNSELEIYQMEPDLVAACRVAVFHVVCWTSLLIKPRFLAENFEDFNVDFPDGVIDMQPSQSIESSTILTGALIRGFCQSNLVPGLGDTNRPERGSDDGLIYVSCMNYYILHEFGRVTIEWTTILSCHMLFIESTRTLYLYSLPTTLALCCLAEDGSAMDSLVEDYYEPSENTVQLWQRYRQEILLSYRLLFGQTRASRKLFGRLKEQIIRNNPSLLDPFLDILCSYSTTNSKITSLPSQIWPKSCRDLEGQLTEFEDYSLDIDFPLIGQNMLVLQRFCLRQRPRSFASFWKDTRDKPKWFTFWVITIVGVLALLLSVVQIGVSVAQLAVSV